MSTPSQVYFNLLMKECSLSPAGGGSSSILKNFQVGVDLGSFLVHPSQVYFNHRMKECPLSLDSYRDGGSTSVKFRFQVGADLGSLFVHPLSIFVYVHTSDPRQRGIICSLLFDHNRRYLFIILPHHIEEGSLSPAGGGSTSIVKFFEWGWIGRIV